MNRAALWAFVTSPATATTACSGKDSPPPDSCGAVPAASIVSAWTADPHYCMIRFASSVTGARQLAIAPNGDVFVAAGRARSSSCHDDDGDGVSDARRALDLRRRARRAITAGSPSPPRHVYASSATRPSTAGRTRPAIAPPPARNGDRRQRPPRPAATRRAHPAHRRAEPPLRQRRQRRQRRYPRLTRTRPPPMRAVIRRYAAGIDYPRVATQRTAGELFAAGLRNEVGLFIDSRGRMWGVENGRDNLMVGGDIHFDNPAEEVNLFDTNRRRPQLRLSVLLERGHLDGHGDGQGPRNAAPGSRRALAPFTEAKCQDASAVVPPAFALRARTWRRSTSSSTPGSGYPAAMRGQPVRHVARLVEPRDRPGGPAHHPPETGADGADRRPESFLGEADVPGQLRQGTWAVRPVSIRVDKAGLLDLAGRHDERR